MDFQFPRPRDKSSAPPPKRRKTASAVQEITFDDSARADYLTGFHKRKLERKKHAQEIALKREKEEKRQQREDLKKQRELHLQEHVKAVNESMKLFNGEESDKEEEVEDSGVEWEGIAEEVKDQEYVDEDQYATVTVEAVDITKDGFVTHGDSDEDEESEDEGADVVKEDVGEENKKPEQPRYVNGKRVWTKEKPASDGRKKRKKSRNFKYESRDERRLNRTKDRAKRKVSAEKRKAKKS